MNSMNIIINGGVKRVAVKCINVCVVLNDFLWMAGYYDRARGYLFFCFFVWFLVVVVVVVVNKLIDINRRKWKENFFDSNKIGKNVHKQIAFSKMNCSLFRPVFHKFMKINVFQRMAHLVRIYNVVHWYVRRSSDIIYQTYTMWIQRNKIIETKKYEKYSHKILIHFQSINHFCSLISSLNFVFYFKHSKQ